MVRLKIFIYNLLKKLLPKSDKIIINATRNIGTNAVEFANYLSAYYRMPVYFVTSEEFIPHCKKLLSPEIKILNQPLLWTKVIVLTSKYIFFTHRSWLSSKNKSPNDQVYVNIWHGAGHKKIGLARGDGGIAADVTVATSDLSKKMFGEFFGVPSDSIFISGYPRNDLMLRAKKDKVKIKKRKIPELAGYDKVIIWMPTFHRKPDGSGNYGMELDHAFNVPGFDTSAFNEILKKQNTLCLLKPHYFYLTNKNKQEFSHIRVIDNEWIWQQGITLYHLLACTDILITDFSSVMIDYSLLDQPVICFSKDLKGFKERQGIYFDDIENWLPTELIQDDESFFEHLNTLLTTEEDPYQQKRRKIRDIYFKYNDAYSSKRLAAHVFGNEKQA